jgi:hypothetical protein
MEESCHISNVVVMSPVFIRNEPAEVQHADYTWWRKTYPSARNQTLVLLPIASHITDRDIMNKV